jgi:acetoin utilization deacetylase AcuC-like enzyme
VLVVYSPRYAIDIGIHVFPTAKYAMVHERIHEGPLGTAPSKLDYLQPQAASWDELASIHSSQYLEKIQSGHLPIAELAQLEIPWSPAIVEGFRLMTGGTIAAARCAVEARPAAVFHIGGGFHHAFPSHGEGFCLFNDVAVAIRLLLNAAAISRAAVVDLDVHHGNGTAFTFADDPRVFTFSMHQENNYPAVKPPGSLDIPLPDGEGDAPYQRKLAGALDRVFREKPDLAFYLAGADPYEDDQLGGLGLTKAGLQQRDRMVLEACRQRGVPVVVLLAGGYARRLDDTVDIHYATALEAAAIAAQ